jgi:dienelactone hydrolase
VPVGTCTNFLPSNVGPADSRPGLGWANGTGGTPGTYTGILSRVASYGTLVTAANTTQSGTGQAVAACINQLDANRVDSNGRFATAGHSQGGSGSINAARLNSKVVVTCPVQLDGTFTATSSPADLRGTLIMCGGADNLAPCARQGNGNGKFNGATVPVTRISVVGAPHTGAGSPTGNGGLYAALVTTCVEAALGGDAQASAALQPGGAQNNNVINMIASRNF